MNYARPRNGYITSILCLAKLPDIMYFEMNMQMINSSMSKFTVEDSKTKVTFFLKNRNNFALFFDRNRN
jgi:hypothetical protein